jgi:phosphoglycerate kinase
MCNIEGLDPRLPVIQDADLEGKIVLVRVDHNVVKNGEIRDPYRIDQTLGTLYNIVERGGRPILMTHIGRPRDKKTGTIKCNGEDSIEPIVRYLEHKLHTKFYVPKFSSDPQKGILGIDTSINLAIKDLKNHKIGGIYLPNTRWFQGEEAKDETRERFTLQLAGLADVFVNDAFGSWQSHASTFDIAEILPSYAGYLMQQEILNLNHVLDPQRPFLAVVAGAKYDTKIGPLQALYEKVDHLVLGGVIYNTFLCAKYGIKVAGVLDEDIQTAKDLVEKDKTYKKILELPCLIESDILEGKIQGKYRTICTDEFQSGKRYGYFLDIDPKSFEKSEVLDTITESKTIFVNAVMGFTPHFAEGSEALDRTIDMNSKAMKLYGGGDTLQEFKNLCPGLYLAVLDNSQYYFFTGGGTVLKAIQEGTPYGLEPVSVLMKDKNNQ